MKQILYIEDDIKIANQVQEVFSDPASNVQVTIASFRDQVIQRLGEQQWDLVITDYSMPGMTGFEVLTRVRETAPCTRVILITGYGNEELERTAGALGIYRYLTKPFPLPHFKSIIQQALNLPTLTLGQDTPAGSPPDTSPLPEF